MNLLKLNRNTMLWPSNGHLVQLKMMSSQHIRNALQLVKRSPRLYWNYQHRDNWIQAFDGELKARVKKSDAFIKKASNIFHNSKILKEANNIIAS